LLDAFLGALFRWCAREGALLLTFSTSVNGQPPGFLEIFKRRMRRHPLPRLWPPNQLTCRFSHRAKEKLDASDSTWNVTGLLFPV
jgi:hypothetical protein